MTRQRFAAWFVPVVFIAGCFGGAPKFEGKLEPVSGKLSVDGSPVAGVVVSFTPARRSNTKGTGASALTDELGQFVLKHRSGQTGIEAGEYKVTFFKYVMPDGSDLTGSDVMPEEVGAVNLFPPQYADVDKTKETATVPEGGKEFTFDIKIKK